MSYMDYYYLLSSDEHDDPEVIKRRIAYREKRKKELQKNGKISEKEILVLSRRREPKYSTHEQRLERWYIPENKRLKNQVADLLCEKNIVKEVLLDYVYRLQVATGKKVEIPFKDPLELEEINELFDLDFVRQEVIREAKQIKREQDKRQEKLDKREEELNKREEELDKREEELDKREEELIKQAKAEEALQRQGLYKASIKQKIDKQEYFSMWGLLDENEDIA